MEAMDVRISGSGVITAGEYNDVKVCGSGKLSGLIRCVNFSSSGSAGGDAEIIASGDVKCSGSAKIEKGITAKNVKTSGALSCDGDVKCGTFKVSGSAKVGGGIEADEIKLSGEITCGGLMNAEKMEIDAERGTIDSIGGGTIIITQKKSAKKTFRLPLFTKLAGATGTSDVTVKNSIEGDTIAIEGVRTPKVVGRVVAIGAGCDIDLAQYSEEIEINDNAKVGRYEKI